MPKEYNLTDLNPESTFERHVYHRDQFAHYLRWTHVLQQSKIGMKVLDFGCGRGSLYEVFYRNLYSPARYLGLDLRKTTINKNKEKFPKAEFETEDLVTMEKDYGTDWDMITSFEVAEHVGRANVGKFLKNIHRHCNPETIVLLSTPVFDPKVGAAENHIINGVIGEMTIEELHNEISEAGFKVEKRYGTFASQRDIKPVLTPDEKAVWDKLKEYYDSNLMSVIFAPLHPDQSRNVLWYLKKS
jgi:cyclopropane fatty-acyl-phospholipid synthase-like methyltransferase